jgi:hypothetical protein
MQRRMRILYLFIVSAVLAFAAFPRVTSVEPDMAKPGDEATAYGSSLDEVVKLFLTTGGQDTEVEMKGHTADEIRFAVPADLAHGAYRLTVQTGGVNAAILVQPIQIEVADAAEIERRKKEREAPPPPVEEPAPTPPAGTPQ